MSTRTWFHWDEQDLVLSIQVQPRAKTSAIVGVHGNALKIQLKSPPVDGLANRELVAFLGAEFGLPRSRVILERGLNSRRKQVRLITPGTLPAAVRSLTCSG